MSWKELFPKENRYFETKNGILYCGDCLKIMKGFPKESVDLVLTDPPYNIAGTNKLTMTGDEIKTNKQAWGDAFKDNWDSIEEYFIWLSRRILVMKGILRLSGGLILFLDRNYTGYFIYRIEKELGLKFRNKIYFEKLNSVPHFRKNNYRSCIEEAIWFTKSSREGYFINFIRQESMRQIFKGSTGEKYRGHPTEKAWWMIEPLIIRHSDTNALILDPFLGSGKTALVCKRLNRRWVGIEILEKYCEVSAKRLDAVKFMEEHPEKKKKGLFI
ncbi:hypothetical protein DRH14_02735 [Candidatus Shapirobacteria bacterium]|nr:MAG: hypothetical protein DRH14_02735 [Candidatus Shapirobacteria bacterium]